MRWIIPALLAGFAALISALPLAWIAPMVMPNDVKTIAPDMTFRGPAWNGAIGGLPMFDRANVKISPLSQRVSLTTGNGQNYLSGDFSRSDAKDIRLRLDLSTLPLTDGRLQGLLGEFSASISSAEYNKTGCLSAEGTASTDVLQRNGGAIDWTGPQLSGPIRCKDGALVAALSGKDSQQIIDAVISLTPDGTYKADITAQTSRAEADAVLPLFGFTRSGRDFKLTEQGRWR